MNDIIRVVLGAVIAALPGIITVFLSDKTTERWGEKNGAFASGKLRKWVGKALEDRIERTVIKYLDGFKKGARKDNQ